MGVSVTDKVVTRVGIERDNGDSVKGISCRSVEGKRGMLWQRVKVSVRYFHEL